MLTRGPYEGKLPNNEGGDQRDGSIRVSGRRPRGLGRLDPSLRTGCRLDHAHRHDGGKVAPPLGDYGNLLCVIGAVDDVGKVPSGLAG
jgi:hypothetical protein